MRACLAASLFVFVLGARWAVVDRFGSDLPEWDQWDAEGLHSLVPWFEHRNFVGELFMAHNEHRVVVTKLANLGLTLADGQWDQRLECTANALLPALIAVGFYLLCSRTVSRRLQILPILLLMAAFGLPLSWQNIVSGFHSQQFFLLGFSFAAVAWLPFSGPGSIRWWLGGAAAILALGSMASGLLAATVAIGLVFVNLLRGARSWKEAAPTLGLCTVLVAIGLFSQVSVPYHEALKAHSVQDFALTTLRALEWPASSTMALAVLFWLPWCWLAWRVCKPGRAVPARRSLGERGPDGPTSNRLGLTLLGLGTWVILQLLATSYARGAGGPDPSSRYIDTLAFGQVVNGLSLAWLWEVEQHGTWRRRGLGLLALAWAAAFAIGAGLQAGQSLSTDLPQIHDHFVKCEQNVGDYLATGDEACLLRPDIPYPSASSLLARIRIPILRELLPGSVRPPISLEGRGAGTGFLGRGYSPSTPSLGRLATWGSCNSAASLHASTWESLPVTPRGTGYLRFQVAGHAGEPGVALELRDARTDAAVAEVCPKRVPGNAWRAVYVHEPSVPFVVAARDGGSGAWLAFSDPVEIGPLSYWAWRLARNGAWIAGLAFLAALALAAATEAGACRRRGSPPTSSPP